MLIGKVNDRLNYKIFTYLHTEINSPRQQEISLDFSSKNVLDIWVNNQHTGKIKQQFFSWYDFWENPQHKGESLRVVLKPGKNSVMVLAVGGRYSGDGFYAYCNMNPPKDKKEGKK
jgi:hypothetical protein